MFDDLPQSLIQSSKEILEARRNPDLNPRIGPYTQLEKYKDDLDIYVSFTDLDKIGIKPSSDFQTPLGIYTYPLKLSWDFYDVERIMKEVINGKESALGRSLSPSELAREESKGIRQAFPFASERPYIQVLKAKSAVTDLQKISQRDLLKIVDEIAKKINDEEVLELYEETAEYYLGFQKRYNLSEGQSLWDLTRGLISQSEYDSTPQPLNDYFLKKYGTSKSMRAWNYFLRDLGFDAFLDKGDSIIHPEEALQAVFLHRGAFRKIDMVYNDASILSKERLPDWFYEAKTRNVDAERGGIDNDGYVELIWHSGVWEDGSWEAGTWKGGIFKGGTWEAGTWENGIFQGGTWKLGRWEDGVWEGGTWETGRIWSKRFKAWIGSDVNPAEFKELEKESEGRSVLAKKARPDIDEFEQI